MIRNPLLGGVGVGQHKPEEPTPPSGHPSVGGYRVYTSWPSPPQFPSPKNGRGGGQTRLSGSPSPVLGEGVGG